MGSIFFKLIYHESGDDDDDKTLPARSVVRVGMYIPSWTIRVIYVIHMTGPRQIELKNLRRIMVRDGIYGESANGLKNGCRRWSVWVWVGQAGRSETAFQTDSMLFLVYY